MDSKVSEVRVVDGDVGAGSGGSREAGDAAGAARGTSYVSGFVPGVTKEVFVIANRTGGQGKTMVAQILSSLMRGCAVLAADSAQSGERSKLTRLLANRVAPLGPDRDGRIRPGHVQDAVAVVDLGIGWSDEKVRESSDAMFWDGLADRIGEAPGRAMIVDLGANVVGSLVEWGEGFGAKRLFSQSGREAVFTFVVPVVASDQAIRDAGEVVDLVLRMRDDPRLGLPVGRIVVVLNEWQGAFDSLRPQVNDLLARHPAIGEVTLAAADPTMARLFEKNMVPVGNIVALDTEDFVKYGLTFIAADRCGSRMKTWFERTRSDFSAVFLPPAEGSAPASLGGGTAVESDHGAV